MVPMSATLLARLAAASAVLRAAGVLTVLGLLHLLGSAPVSAKDLTVARLLSGGAALIRATAPAAAPASHL